MANVTNRTYRDGNFSLIETKTDNIVTDIKVFKYYDSYVNEKGEAQKCVYTIPVIPDGVTSIGGNSFRFPMGTQYCKDIKYIYIPDSVKQIEPYAFTACKNLECVRMSRNMEWIGDNAFANLPKLWKMKIPDKCNFGCKYYNDQTGEHYYKNEISQIAPNCPKLAKKWTPWIEYSSEYGVGTVIFEAEYDNILQMSFDKKNWENVELKQFGLYQYKLDDKTRYFRIVAPNTLKTARNNTDYIAKTKIIKI